MPGEVTVSELQRTLDELESDVAQVYWHITGGTISNVNTDPRAVIAVADDLVTEMIDEELDALRKKLVTEDSRVLRCAFCGEAYPSGTPVSQHELLTAHVWQCTHHPLAKVRQVLRILAVARDQHDEAFEMQLWEELNEMFAAVGGVRG